MSAYKFIKEHGLEKAKEKLNRMSIFRWVTPEIQEMKQAIADFELVEKCGGLENTRINICLINCNGLESVIQRIEQGLN